MAHGKDNHRTTLHGWVQRIDLKAKRLELLFSVFTDTWREKLFRI
jgi:hypothetical protein